MVRYKCQEKRQTQTHTKEREERKMYKEEMEWGITLAELLELAEVDPSELEGEED